MELAKKKNSLKEINLNDNMIADIDQVAYLAKFKHLSKILNVKFQPLPIDPQIMGAVGAALIAKERKLTEIERQKEN